MYIIIIYASVRQVLANPFYENTARLVLSAAAEGADETSERGDLQGVRGEFIMDGHMASPITPSRRKLSTAETGEMSAARSLRLPLDSCSRLIAPNERAGRR